MSAHRSLGESVPLSNKIKSPLRAVAYTRGGVYLCVRARASGWVGVRGGGVINYACLSFSFYLAQAGGVNIIVLKGK